MATYYHGNSEIGGGGGGDGLQTLILMNPAYVGYSDGGQQPPSSNFVFLNSASAANTLAHAPPSFVGVPFQNTTSTSTTSPHEQQQQHVFPPRVPYNLYNLPAEHAAARDVTRAQQGLSLSLSSQHPPPGYASFRPEAAAAAAVSSPRGEEVRVSGGSPSPASGVSNGVNGVQSVLLSSKYLSAAQELLDEVVNVGKGVKTAVESSKGQPKSNGDSAAAAASGEAHSGGGDSSGKRGAELTTAERQEIQMKKAKLVNMLDEVEQRYRQYQHQMQIVITWFEQAAGAGAAKTYTALALETISKQFRCLKDAILGQIRGASKSLGEEENVEGKIEGSRLKYVDNQMRQQRALQQLGMIQYNAWRPQRGLPERSVSVLRAWLFEHFLHPYPKDSDKLMLAKQTGLTRSQVSNWFINARVRLWKPMVEEMYTEEMKDHDKNGNTGDKTTKTEQKNDNNNDNDNNPTTKSTVAPQVKSPGAEQQRNKTFVDNFVNSNTVSPPPPSPNGTTISGFKLMSEMGSSPKKLRISDMLHSTTTAAATIPLPINMDSKPSDSDNDTMLMKFGGDRQERDGFTLMGAPTNVIGGFGAYPMGDLGRFGTEQFQTPYSGNGVSLTLGLPHCENIAMSGAHQSFLPNQTMQLGRTVEIGEANDFGGMDASANTHPANVYDINIQNRKRFAAQLLPDFVA